MRILFLNKQKKVLTVFKISFYVELFELSILRILHWFIIKSIIFIYYFKEAFFFS